MPANQADTEPSSPSSHAHMLSIMQSGAYLGEDDIVRFEDRYGRS